MCVFSSLWNICLLIIMIIYFQKSALKEELRRLHQENHKLKNMLEQITNNYNQLHAHLFMHMTLHKQNTQVYFYSFITLLVLIFQPVFSYISTILDLCGSLNDICHRFHEETILVSSRLRGPTHESNRN